MVPWQWLRDEWHGIQQFPVLAVILVLLAAGLYRTRFPGHTFVLCRLA